MNKQTPRYNEHTDYSDRPIRGEKKNATKQARTQDKRTLRKELQAWTKTIINEIESFV